MFNSWGVCVTFLICSHLSEYDDCLICLIDVVFFLKLYIL